MLAVKCGKLVDKNGKVKNQEVILIKNGCIVAVEDNFQIPTDVDIIDASSLWVTPGLIEAHCHGAADLDDLNETAFTSITPDMKAIDAIHPFMKDIPVIRKAGFTTLCVLPGSANLFGGSGVIIKLKSALVASDMAVFGKEPFKMAMGENPKRIAGLNHRLPSTRMANAALIRRTFIKAQNYINKKNVGEFDVDPEMEALVPVLKGEKRVRFHAHQSADMVTAVGIAREFGLDYSLEHVTQGEKIAYWLAENKIPCVVGPLLIQPLKKEMEGIFPTLPATLERAGLDEFALISDDNFGVVYLPMSVGCCIGYGLSWEAGIRGITINAAKALQIEDRVGSLEVGKDADLAFFNGDPLLNTTRCVGTMIDGVFYDRDF